MTHHPFDAEAVLELGPLADLECQECPIPRDHPSS